MAPGRSLGLLLLGLLAVALHGAHAAAATAANATNKVDVIVVGAGISGLTAALQLHQVGLSVLVLEARNRTGGRLWRALAGSGNNSAWIDIGGQWVGDTQDRFLALMDEFGVAKFPTPAPPGNTIQWRYGREQDASDEEVADYEQLLEKVEEIAAGIDPAAPWEHPNATDLDTTTMVKWIQANAKTPFGAYWVAQAARSRVEPNTTSILHYAWHKKISPETENPQGYLLDGAAGQLPELMTAALPKGAVRLNEPVVKLERTASGVAATTLEGRYEAGAVVVATPPHLAGRIQYEPPMDSLRSQLTMNAPLHNAIKVLVSYSTPWWRAQNLTGSAQAMGTESLIGFIVDCTNPRPGSPGMLVSFIVGDAAAKYGAATKEERRAVVLRDLAAVYGPEAESEAIGYDEGHWPADPWAGGSVFMLTPGTWTNFGKTLRPALWDGRLLWAGTEVAERWAGYIDGGIRSGEKAATDAAKAVRSA